MFQEYIINKIAAESTTIKSFYLSPKNGGAIPDYIAGQFVNIKIQPPGSDKVLTRSYTLSDSPKKNYLRLTIKNDPNGKVSGFMHDIATIGDTVLMSNPAGNFHLTTDANNPLILLSGGVGITPMLSMAEYVNVYQPHRKIYFLHSSLHKNVQPMLQRLKQLNTSNANFGLSIFHSHPLEDEAKNIDYDYEGFITKNRIPVSDNAAYYVCGPVGFMDTMFTYLKELNVDEDKIFFESFGGDNKIGAKQLLVDSTTKSFDVRLTKSNKQISWREGMGSLLELIESAGLTPDNSCRMGTCSTCESKLTKGTYEYDPEPFMEATEGHVLICCAKPTSDIEIEL